MVENILVDFKVDYSELDSALDVLSNTGAIDSKIANSFKRTTTEIKNTSTETKGLITAFNTVKGTATAMGSSVRKAFDQGVNQALDQAGVSITEFNDALKKASTAPVSLRTELRNLTQSIAEAKANGKDLGAEFEAMRKRAGLLKDSIKDANAEINNTGSDTRRIDNVVGSISAVAGGFAAAQGAAALFGDESEDVQKALLKVNGALAISQGLQQVTNALTKEGAITKLADSVATGYQSAAQTIYTAVTGRATAATLAFKIALASTGIGLFLLAIAALVIALQNTDDSLKKVNEQIAIQNNLIESTNKLISRQTDLAVANAKAQGKAQSEILKIQAKGIQAQRDYLIAENQGNASRLKSLDATSDAWFELNKQIEKNSDTIIDLNNQINIANAEGSFQVREEIKETAQKRKEAGEKALADAKKNAEERRVARQKELEDDLAALELGLLNTKKIYGDETDLLKQIVRKKADIELNEAGLTKNKIALINARALDDQIAVEQEYRKNFSKEQLEDIINSNNAELEQLNITNEEKLRLTIDNINNLAQIEILAAEKNVVKILEIKAKQEADIRKAKIESMDKSLADEIALNDLRVAAGRRTLQAIADNEKKSAKERIEAVNSITKADVANVDKELENLKSKHDQILISEEDFTKQLLTLEDKRNKLLEGAKKSTKDIKKEELEQVAQLTIEIAGKVSDFFSSLNDLAAEQENQKIESQKRQLDELVEAGAISQKQAEIRAKEIEVMERNARTRQAQAEKKVAVFNALLAIPQAYLAGLKSGPQGLILGPIFAGIAALQAALIIARPIPKFAKGKKDGYEGLGMVGEAGAELIESNGRMFLAPKQTILYLGSKDKVFTAKETTQIMHNTNKINAPVINENKIDYEKMGKIFSESKSSTSININKDFISESVAEGLIKNNYYNNRYSF